MSPIERVKSIPSELPPARLYLEDIDDIIRVLIEVGKRELTQWHKEGNAPEARVTLYLKGFKCDSTEEARRIATRTGDLSIEVDFNNILGRLSMHITSSGTHWSLYSLSYDTRWFAYAKLREIFERRRVTWKALVNDAPLWLGAVALFSVFMILLMGVVAAFPQALAYKNGILLASLAITVLILHAAFSRHTIVELRSIHEKAGIVEFAKKFIPYAVGAAIGSAVTFFVTRLLQKVWP